MSVIILPNTTIYALYGIILQVIRSIFSNKHKFSLVCITLQHNLEFHLLQNME